MFRSHRGLLAAGLAAVFTLTATAVFAQGRGDQGQGNQGGRRGQGGPGGFGGGPGGFGGGPGGFGGGPGGFGGGPGGGFGGRGGGNPLDAIPMLLTVDVVQAELKLNDKQKQQITEITTKANEKRNALRDKMRANRGDRGNNRGGNNNGGNDQGGNDRGGFNTPEMQAMFAEMTAIQKDTESALAKVLEKPQATRAAQVAWQLAGVQAFRMDILVKKLNLDEGQVAQIDEILDGMRDAQRESFRAAFANMRGNNGENGGRTRGNTAENGGRTRGTNTAENGGRPREATKGENDGENGGRGNRPDFNSPEFQARMADMRTQQAALDEKTMGSIGKVLKKNQKAVYQNLVGVKFKDLDKVRQRRRGGPDGGNTPATANATPAAATTPAAPATTATPTTTTRPQTLSERRRAAAAAAAAPK